MGMLECVREVGKNILRLLVFLCFYSICVPRRIYEVFPLVKIIVESFFFFYLFKSALVLGTQLKNCEVILSLVLILVI